MPRGVYAGAKCPGCGRRLRAGWTVCRTCREAGAESAAVIEPKPVRAPAQSEEPPALPEPPDWIDFCEAWGLDLTCSQAVSAILDVPTAENPVEALETARGWIDRALAKRGRA
jgi:hypothetical protein